ncbi:MAG: ABC transporter ATP-binding protein [bacterium]|nr:ABC transporter ATP-binding protein [bacterium]
MSLSRYFTRGSHTIKAVDRIDLTISAGEFLGIVGSSGSGKSTLLNLLAGLDSPTEGQILFESGSMNSWDRSRLARYRAESVGMVFQSFNLLSYKTAVENVAMALYFSDLPRSLRTAKATAMLERLGLADRLDHRPSDLSGGEQQRVAIARALVKSPKMLFADEPTGNLDQENSTQISELLTELNEEGLTVIMVTHDIELARKSTHRIIRMHYGSIVESHSGETE